MWNESSLAITNLWSTNTGGETRSFRDGAFSIKLLALIDQLVFGFVGILAGTGRTTELVVARAGEDNTVMTHEDEDLSIDSPLDWVFAFEGGAHILFRNTSSSPIFVSSPYFTHQTLKKFMIKANCTIEGWKIIEARKVQ